MTLIVKNKGTRLFLPPGKGKTATVLKGFDILKKAGHIDALLVIAPLRVITTSWPGQLERWEDFEHLSYVTIHGGKTERQWAMKQDVDVYLMNVEGLLTSEWRMDRKNKKYVLNEAALKFLQGKRVMLAVDESTLFKNSDSQRFKTLKRYLPYINRQVIMTGTPKPNTLEDLFAQCYITDEGEDLGEFVTHFRSKYMQRDFDGNYIPLEGAMEKVAAKISTTTLQLNDDEGVPCETIDIWVKMPDDVKAQYNELRREFIAMIEGQTIMAPNAGVLLGKLHQLAQGAIFLPHTDKEWMAVHGAKLDALEGILAELNGEPAFCLYNFIHDWQRVEDRLGHSIPRIGGGVSATQGAAWCASFSAGDIPLLLGQPKSVARGVDGLQQNCRVIIWLSMTWSWEEYYQALKRIARDGTKADKVFIYRILCDCPSERAMVAAVQEKQLSEAEFLGHLRKFML